MTVFICQSEYSVSKDKLFAFFEDPIGFDTLVGNSPGVQVLKRPNSLHVGEIAILKVPILPFIKWKWVSEHVEYKKNEYFVDTQTSGPFRKFVHKHKLENSSREGYCILTDEIELDFFLFPISKWFILPMLKIMFLDRHRVTAKALSCEYKNLFCGYSRTVIN